jgi:hypothetical protein
VKNKTGIIFSVIFILIYLTLFYSFLNFYRNEDVRTNVNEVSPGFVSKVVTNATGSVDEHCGEFIRDKEEKGANGLEEIGHVGNKNQFCYFSYRYLVLPSYAVGILPTLFAHLINCPDWNNCLKEMGSAGYGIGIFVFLAQLILVVILGYLGGEIIGKVFRKDK